jgi:hypothetical protein
VLHKVRQPKIFALSMDCLSSKNRENKDSPLVRIMKEKAKLNNARAILHLKEGESKDSSQPARVQQILKKTEGVLKVDTNYLTNTLSIEYDPSMISLDDIKEAISEPRS